MHRVLLGEDNEGLRQAVKNLLAQCEGWSVCGEASNGREAFDMAKSENPDLVLSDWNMPEMTGIEVLRQLRASGSDVKFGFVTSESTPEMKDQAEAAGALFFIVKPFSAERFDEVFAPILG